MNAKRRILLCSEYSCNRTGYSRITYELLSRLHKTSKYELAELATYAKPEDPRINYLPWKVYPVLPAEGNQAEQAAYGSRPDAQFGAWKFEQVCLDFQPDIVCFPPGKLVCTEKGYKNIEDIQIGEKVLTHMGRFRKVTNTFNRDFRGNLVAFKTKGVCDEFLLTKEHPVYCYREVRQTYSKQTKEKMYQDEIPVFVPAQDLKIGDNSCSPIFELPNKIRSISTFLPKNKRLKLKTIKNKVPINNDFGRYIGYLLGDGAISKVGTISFSFSLTEFRFCKDVKKLTKKLFGIKSKITKFTGKKNYYCVTSHSKLLSAFLKKITNNKNNFPFFTWKSNSGFVKGILCGLVRSDGSYKKKEITFSNTKKTLIHEFRLACSLIGINSYISKHNVDYSWETVVASLEAIKLHDVCKKHENFNPSIGRLRTQSSIKRIKNNIISKIHSIREIPYTGKVYNLEVEEDNSYVVEQVCFHNCDVRDVQWMSTYQLTSPLRRHYKLIWMPTIDSYPQMDDWVNQYNGADKLLAYSNFGYRTLERLIGPEKLSFVATPGVNFDDFKPLDKEKIRSKYGIGDINLIGMIARNQIRKLYPDLFKTFRLFLDKAPKELADKTFLHIHTGFPDQGWDIPRLLKENGLSHKIYFTYICRACGEVSISKWNDYKLPCKTCRAGNAVFFTSPAFGVDEKTLCEIYNLYDLYVQYAALEGLGIPIVEAAACGIPVCVVPFSAPEDFVDTLNAFPIPIAKHTCEDKSHRTWAFPDNEKFATNLIELLGRDLKKWGKETYELTKQYYNWDDVAKLWEIVIDSMDDSLDWKSPKITELNPNIDMNSPDNVFVRDCITNIGLSPHLINSLLHHKFLRDLQNGTIIEGANHIPYTRQHVINTCQALRSGILFWDKERCQKFSI